MFAEGLAGTGPDAFISQTSVKKYYLPLRAFLARPVVLKPSTLISKWSLLVFRITLKTCTTISLQVGIIHQGQNPRTTKRHPEDPEAHSCKAGLKKRRFVYLRLETISILTYTTESMPRKA